MEELKRAGIFFSLSFTVTRSNFDTVTDPAFARRRSEAGCRLFFFLEYTPIRAGTDEWVITDEQREADEGTGGVDSESGSRRCSLRCPGTRRSRAAVLPRAAVLSTSARRRPGTVPIRTVFGRQPQEASLGKR